MFKVLILIFAILVCIGGAVNLGRGHYDYVLDALIITPVLIAAYMVVQYWPSSPGE